MPDTRHNLQIRTTVKDLASNELRKLGSTGKTAGASIAAGFIKAQLAIGAVKLAIRGTINAIRSITTDFGQSADRIAKLSRQLGVAVEGLSEMGHVAEFSGTNIEAVGTSVRFLQRAMSEATTRGTATYVDAFEQLHLTTGDLARLMRIDGVEAFTEIGDRIARLPTQAERTQVAMALMGRSASQIIPIFDQGAGAIRQMREEVRRFGGTLGENEAKMAEAFQDARKRWDLALEGIRKGIAVSLLPSLTVALNKVSTFLADNRDKIVESVKGFLAFIGAGIIDALEYVSIEVAKLIDAIKGLNAKNLIVGAMRSPLFGGPASSALEKLGLLPDTEIGDSTQAVREFWKTAREEFAKGVAFFQDKTGGGGRGVIFGIDVGKLNAMTQAIDAVTESIEKVRLIGGASDETVVRGKRGFFDKFLYGDLQGEGKERKLVGGVREAIAKMRESLTPENLGMTVVQSATQAWTGFFDAITFGAQSAGDAFRAMATSMLRQLANLANQRLFAELLNLIPGIAGAGNRGGTPTPAPGTIR